MTTALIDLDIVVVRAANMAATEDPESPLLYAKRMVQDTIDDWTERAECDQYNLYRSCRRSSNFRRLICSEYKANRDKARNEDKENFLITLWQWVMSRYPVIWGENLGIEADDMIAMAGVRKHGVMVTIDKDLKTVPGLHFNPDKDTQVRQIGVEQAWYDRIYQWLIGDSTDGITGCKGIGPKKADQIIGDLNAEEWGPAAYEIYMDRGYTREKALQQWLMVSLITVGWYPDVLQFSMPCDMDYEEGWWREVLQPTQAGTIRLHRPPRMVSVD